MRHSYILTTLFLLFPTIAHTQAVFKSNATGNWNDSACWTLVSGTPDANIPTSADSVIITTANTITVTANTQCQSLSINSAGILLLNTTNSILTVSNALNLSAASMITIDLGALTVTKQATIGGASTVTINQGLFTILGLLLLNAPTTTTGTTLLNVAGGAFSCVGGMSITATTVPANRFAELNIGNSAVTVAGTLTAISANSKVIFTGTGALTLAGFVSIPATSFTAGNGTVIYTGIPGTDQTIAPLSYNKLVITGFGNGIKKINADVSVSDTLTLLSDTLLINTGGTLTLTDSSAIVRTAGKLINPPTFAGTIDLVYNDVTKDTTGNEMPLSPDVLNNLTVNNIGGIQLSANTTVNNQLTLLNGPLITDTFAFTIANGNGGTPADPAVQRTNGYVIGAINRSINTSVGIRLFPLGLSNQLYREFKIEYTTTPTTAGTLTVLHINSAAPSQSGFPLSEDSVIIQNTAPAYWQANASTTLSGGTYNLTLTGQGLSGITTISNLRLLKRPSSGGPWTLNGTPGANTGTTSIPVVSRTGMSGFSQFALGNNIAILAVSYLTFSGTINAQNILLQWSTPSNTSDSSFSIEHSTNGSNFQTLRSLPATTNNTSQTNYAFTHSNVPAGAHYYRLKIYDAHNGFAYSNLLYFHIPTNATLKVYPTLATQTITIESSDNTLQLRNISGQYLGPLHPGINNINWLPKGLYYVLSPGGNQPFLKE